jgi:hypothetical protein
MIDGSVVVLHLPSLVEIARFETDGSHSGECPVPVCQTVLTPPRTPVLTPPLTPVLIPLTQMWVCMF